MALSSLLAPRRRGLRRRSELLHPLEREFNRMLDDFWLSPFGEASNWPGTYLPPVNVREEDNQVVASVEVPGMEEKDIEVTVRNDTVRICGEKKEEEKTRDEDFYRMETLYGRFDRVIDLPTEVQEDKVEATLKNGVLTIKMPKREEAKAKTRKIPVKTG